jgi:amino acid transporter
MTPVNASAAHDSRQLDVDPLSRGLGVASIVFMVVAAAAPLGATIAIIPLVFALSGSTASPLYFAASAAVLIVFAVGFTTMSRHVTNAGAFYSYVQAGLGRVPGGGAAILALVSYTVLLIALYALIGEAARNLTLDYLDASPPWWVMTAVFALVIGLLGFRDIQLSAKVLGVILVAEVCIVLVLNVGVLLKGGDAGLSAEPFNPAAALDGAPGLGLMFAILCFVGFEATAVFRSEAKEPDKTIPRATFISVVAIGLFYTVTAWAVSLGLGVNKAVDASSADPGNLIFSIMEQYVSSAAMDLMQVLNVTSLFACTLSFHNVLTRYGFNLGKVGLMPSRLAAVHPGHRSPAFASLVVSAVTVVLLAVVLALGLEPVTEAYTWFSGAATLGLTCLMTITTVAVLAFHRQGSRLGDSLWSATVAPIVSVVALGGVLYLMVSNFSLLVGGTTPAYLCIGGLVASFVLGVVLAVRMAWRRPDAYAALLDHR